MRPSVAAFLVCCAVQAQNLNDASVIRPGDILVVKIYYEHGFVGKTMFVKSDGTITPPEFPGIKLTEDVQIEALTLDEARRRLNESYVALKPWARFGIGIERGTLSKLLGP